MVVGEQNRFDVKFRRELEASLEDLQATHRHTGADGHILVSSVDVHADRPLLGHANPSGMQVITVQMSEQQVANVVQVDAAGLETPRGLPRREPRVDQCAGRVSGAVRSNQRAVAR